MKRRVLEILSYIAIIVYFVWAAKAGMFIYL